MPDYPNGKELVLKTSDGASHCRFESCVRRGIIDKPSRGDTVFTNYQKQY